MDATRAQNLKASSQNELSSLGSRSPAPAPVFNEVSSRIKRLYERIKIWKSLALRYADLNKQHQALVARLAEPLIKQPEPQSKGDQVCVVEPFQVQVCVVQPAKVDARKKVLPTREERYLKRLKKTLIVVSSKLRCMQVERDDLEDYNQQLKLSIVSRTWCDKCYEPSKYCFCLCARCFYSKQTACQCS